MNTASETLTLIASFLMIFCYLEISPDYQFGNSRLTSERNMPIICSFRDLAQMDSPSANDYSEYLSAYRFSVNASTTASGIDNSPSPSPENDEF